MLPATWESSPDVSEALEALPRWFSFRFGRFGLASRRPSGRRLAYGRRLRCVRRGQHDRIVDGDEQPPLADPPHQVRVSLLEGLDVDAVECSGLGYRNFPLQFKRGQTGDTGGEGVGFLFHARP